jgi:hypothetical protein
MLVLTSPVHSGLPHGSFFTFFSQYLHKISRLWHVHVTCLTFPDLITLIIFSKEYNGRSQWPRGLKRGSAAACLLGLWGRIRPSAWMSVSCVWWGWSGRGLCEGLFTRPEESYRGSAAACLVGLWVRISPRAWMSVCCECCVLSGRGLCDGLITRPEESYRVWCV